MSDRSHPLVELTRARILEFLREPEGLFWTFVFPILLALALGIAFRNRPPETTRVAVVARPGSAWVLGALENAAGIEARVRESADAAVDLRTGRVDVVVMSALDGSSVGVGGSVSAPAVVVIRGDPTRAETRLARALVVEALRRARGASEPVEVRDEDIHDPGARYIDFLVPGLIGLNLLGSGMWGIGFAVVLSRTRKMLKRFAATPMRRSHYLASFALSRLVFLALEVAVLVGFARVLFGVRVHGSLLHLAVISVLGSACFAALGLLVAARPRTIEGVSGWMNAVMLPMWLLSGTFFSSERFPEALRPAIRLLPLTAVNDALRGVMNDGAGLVALRGELAVMVAWGVASFLLSLRIFRWQ